MKDMPRQRVLAYRKNIYIYKKPFWTYLKCSITKVHKQSVMSNAKGLVFMIIGIPSPVEGLTCSICGIILKGGPLEILQKFQNF